MSQAGSCGTGHALNQHGLGVQKMDEEILCEILRILAAIAASADEGVHRVAIKTIEFF